ncbi:MAG TPA: VCBS repeat-containing protein [Candidatus Hydrogenedens sp.]|nr:VCBS repeat-containing protein [Candidatus Hydrogenedens sp.]HOL19059.1 VCBS repeat-containing protein [Candidatus Hydrogenedens sp.]
MLPIIIFCVSQIISGAETENYLLFQRERIGQGIYESASSFDVNNDGIIDIFSGEYWYEGPDYKKSHRVCVLQPMDDYYDDFSNFPMDVNGDGYLDVITGGWWGKTLRWRENPKGNDGLWNTHNIAEVGNIERAVFYDLDKDGIPEVIPVTKPVFIFKLKMGEDGKPTGSFDKYEVKTDGAGGHGFGCGDVDGDGAIDFLFSGGWLKSPINPFDTENWQWFPEWNLGSASVPILVFDVNKNGKNDIIVGSAHDYGLFWYEQKILDDGKRSWEKHVIDENRSQYHDIQLHDIDNDGELELITGKRYRAHAFHDPGSKDPLGVYYFKINKGDFVRYTLDYGPAGQASGVGIYFWVDDIDKNSWKDIIAPGKEGLFLFKNFGPIKSNLK